MLTILETDIGTDYQEPKMSNDDSTPRIPEPPRYGQRLPEGESANFGNNASSNAPREGFNSPSEPTVGTGSSVPASGNAQPGQQPAQSPYGQNPYNQNPYGQAPAGHNPAGQNAYGQQNPYNQNPYGQNAYGQQQLGQPGAQQQGNWNMPMQQGGFGAPAVPARPKELKIASILLYIAAALTIIGGIALLMVPNQMLVDVINSTPNASEQFDELEKQGISVNELVSMSKTVGAVFTFIAGLLYAVIGYFIGKGSNGARITGTVLAALSLMVFAGAGIQGWLMLALGVAAIVLAWLRPSSKYIAAKSAAKRYPRA